MSKLTEYTVKKFGLIIKYLDQFRINGDADSMHDLRVEIKKLRSVYRMAGKLNEKFNYQRQFELLKTIFKNGGAIRSIDVMLESGNDFPGLLSKAELKKKNTTRKRLATNFRKKTAMMKRSVMRKEKSFPKLIDDFHKKDVVSYIKKKIKKLEKKLHYTNPDDALHEHRKKMKEIIYLSDAVDYKNKVLGSYKKLQEMIGEWHDKSVLIEQLKNSSTRTNKKLVKDLEAAERKDKGKIKDLLSGML
jgi:CHAD domain-containing protein